MTAVKIATDLAAITVTVSQIAQLTCSIGACQCPSTPPPHDRGDVRSVTARTAGGASFTVAMGGVPHIGRNRPVLCPFCPSSSVPFAPYVGAGRPSAARPRLPIAQLTCSIGTCQYPNTSAHHRSDVRPVARTPLPRRSHVPQRHQDPVNAETLTGHRPMPLSLRLRTRRAAVRTAVSHRIAPSLRLSIRNPCRFRHYNDRNDTDLFDLGTLMLIFRAAGRHDQLKLSGIGS